MLLVLLVSGCGYRFAADSGNRLASGSTLWVSFITIESDSRTAQTVLRRALLEEAHALRGLPPATSAASADFQVKGVLKAYANRAMSYNPLDQVRQYRLTIDVELELTKRGETKPFWKGTIQSYQDFPANTDLALQRSSEEAALDAASRTLARKFLMAVEQGY
jgi:outer membrane lipopolysaccharide assembly protein LptE/RlpB